jgi:hypothetical protein
VPFRGTCGLVLSSAIKFCGYKSLAHTVDPLSRRRKMVCYLDVELEKCVGEWKLCGEREGAKGERRLDERVVTCPSRIRYRTAE